MTAAATVQALAGRDPADPSVVLADGYGIAVHVSRGHLVISDGLGRHRRERRLTRSQRTVRRVVILGHTGNITLDAVRWCHDTGISLTALDSDGRLLFTAGVPGRDDARLRRAQAAAANSDTGVEVARALLTAKIAGQAAVADAVIGNPEISAVLHQLVEQVSAAGDLIDIRAIEATAANVYFGSWAGSVTVRFAAMDLARVPDHWQRFDVRRSPINRSSARTAAEPVNAMLNYSYALAEAEARIALLALGLDPGIGIIHTDKKNRDSLALDLLEPLRPIVDQHVLDVLVERRLTRDDVHETRTGACRLLPPLTHDLAAAIPSYATTAARVAEQVTHALGRSVPGAITLTTPLSRINTANRQIRGARSATRATATVTNSGAATLSNTVKMRRTCQNCGTDLYGSARKLCPTCWPVARKEYMRQLGLARAKPHTHDDPKPSTEALSGGLTLAQYQTEVLPGLSGVSLAEIERVTGLLNGSCSRIRRGLQIPNPRHWAALAELGRPSHEGTPDDAVGDGGR